MLLTEQVKAKMEYICFLKSFHGNPDCKVFSLNQTSLHLVGRPTSGPWLSCMGPWLHPPASLGLKERWRNKLSSPVVLALAGGFFTTEPIADIIIYIVFNNN